MMHETAAATDGAPAGPPAKRSRVRRVILILSFTALLLAVGAAWWLRPRTTSWYTDGSELRVPARQAPVRDVLWREPVPLPIPVNLVDDAYEPALAIEGDTLLLVRGRTGGSADIFCAQRIGETWSEPQPLDAVNSSADDLGPRLSGDRLALYFYSDRPQGAGGFDLWISRRDAHSAPFGPAINLGNGVNSAWDEYSPAAAPDGSTLYFSSNRPRPGEPAPSAEPWSATLRAARARRDFDLYAAAADGGSFGPAEALARLNTTADEGTPAVSPVGDFLYFSSNRPASHGAQGFGGHGFDLYRVRLLPSDFSAIESIRGVNTAANELDPALSMGGFALHFSSDRPAADGNGPPGSRYRIYSTTSREVYVDRETVYAAIDWGAIWAVVVPALLALLLLLLLLLVGRPLWNAAQRRRLSLLVRCLLASLFLHMLLAALFTVWHVSTSLGEFFKRPGGVRVALTSAAQSSDLARQVRGGFTAPPDAPILALAALRAPVRLASFQPAIDDLPAPPRTKVTVAPEDQPRSLQDARVEPPRRALRDPMASIPQRTLDEFSPTLPDAPQRISNAEPARESVDMHAIDPAPPRAVLPQPVASAEVSSIGLSLGRATLTDAHAESVPQHGGRIVDATPPPIPPAHAVRSANLPQAVAEPIAVATPPVQVARAAGGQPASPVAPALVLDALRPPVLHAPATPAVDPLELDLPGAALGSDAAQPEIPRASARDAAVAAVPIAKSSAAFGLNLLPLEASTADRDPWLPEIVVPPPQLNTITGEVTDAHTGAALVAAQVRLDLSAGATVSAATDAHGNYALEIPAVPEFFAISASAEGYLPASTNVAADAVRDRALAVHFRLRRANLGAVAVEAAPDVHHLGDDHFTGSVNSQFQKSSEGAVYTATFELSAQQVAPYITSGEMVMLTRGVQMPHPIYFNGTPSGLRLAYSPDDGSFGEFRTAIDISALRAGRNTLTLRALSRGDDIDDFEFVNIQVHLHP